MPIYQLFALMKHCALRFQYTGSHSDNKAIDDLSRLLGKHLGIDEVRYPEFARAVYHDLLAANHDGNREFSDMALYDRQNRFLAAVPELPSYPDFSAVFPGCRTYVRHNISEQDYTESQRQWAYIKFCLWHGYHRRLRLFLRWQQWRRSRANKSKSSR